MTGMEEEVEFGQRHRPMTAVRVRVNNEFEVEVLEKLGRLETKMDLLMGNHQPGRMQVAESRLNALEKSEIRRGVYDRLASAAIAFVVSVGIALHDHFGLR